MPAAFSGAMNLAGLPAEVVTKRMPDCADEAQHGVVLEEADRQVDAERQAAARSSCVISRWQFARSRRTKSR
jgi:hypothetical protein